MAITPEQVGAWLAAARERAGLSQAAAGRAIEKDSQQISKWERAVSDMGASTFLQLVQVYGGREVLRAISLRLGVSPTLLGLNEHVPRVAEPDVPRGEIEPPPTFVPKGAAASAKKGGRRRRAG
jgi:transcriptional regulator with XRE-family HTH domain